MHVCIFEDDKVVHLQPLVHTRAVYDLRLGKRTLLETTVDAFGCPPLVLHTRTAVAAMTALEQDRPVNKVPDARDVLFVNGRYVAEEGPVLERLRKAARPGEPGRVFTQGNDLVAAWVPNAPATLYEGGVLTRASFQLLPDERLEGARLVGHLWDLLDELNPALLRDYQAHTKGYNIFERPGAVIQEGARLVGGEDIYIAPGATIHAGAILNAQDGPIFIDKDAVVMEQAVVRGPCYIGPHTQVKIGASVEESAIGPWCKVGGEVHGSVLHSFSSKAHAGYLGNSYLGRWCNLGAGTDTSNLRNDYGIVSLYNEALQTFEKSGRQFMGLFMGDHSKCGIHTMFNTGSVIGVYCNLYGTGYQPRYVPSFSWGSPQASYISYRLPKALAVAERVMARRKKDLSKAERALLTALFESTIELRAAFQGHAKAG